MELLFDEQHNFWGVHIDHLEQAVPTGGEKMQLDPWILRPGLSVVEAQAALHAQQLAYRLRPDPFDTTLVHLALETGAILYFRVRNEEERDTPDGLCLLDYPDRLKHTYYDTSGQALKSGHHKRASGSGA